MDRDQIICVCQDVTAGEIMEAIRRYGSLAEVRRRTFACVTCFGCEMELEALFDEHAAEAAALGPGRNEEREASQGTGDRDRGRSPFGEI